MLVRARNSGERDGNGLKTEWEHNCDAENPFPGSAFGYGSVNFVDFSKKHTKSSLEVWKSRATKR